jgi:hypothetical protein
MSFSRLAESAQRNWKKWRRSGVQAVPNVTFGWHPGPRLDTPCDWTNVYQPNGWVEYPTAQELTDHLAYALSYVNHPETVSAMMANTVIVYGWNEHDEGGWICPTIEVDENGNQLFHEDGTPMINDSHLQAAKSAIDQYKNGTLPALTINGVTHKAQAPEADTETTAAETVAETAAETAAESTTESPESTADDGGHPRAGLAIGIGCGAVLLAAAAVAVASRLKGKRKK